MHHKKTRIIGWIAGAALLTASAGASNPYAEQMDAVVRIGTEQIQLRLDTGIALIEKAQSDAVSVLMVAEQLGVDDQTLRLAEFDAKGAVRDAADLARADLRGMANNTVATLENFAATPDQINTVLTRWDDASDALEAAIEDAMDAVEDATPAYTGVAISQTVSVSGLSDTLLAEAPVVLEAMAEEMEAELRMLADDAGRTLRQEKMRSHAPKVFRSMGRQAQRDAKSQAKAMLAILREQFKAYDKALKQQKASRTDRRAVKLAFKDAQAILMNAAQDAAADIKASS